MADPTADEQSSISGKPTLHHLNNSQSQRILWLLEELSIPYTLILYARDKGMRAPAALAKIHPLGKAPILVTASGHTLTESMTIATYLLETYSSSPSKTPTVDLRDLTLTSMAGTSIGNLLSNELLFDLAAKHTPWPLVYIARKIKRSFDNFFSNKEFLIYMEYLTKELGERDWFGGEGKEPGRADYMLSWPMDMIAQRGYVDLEKDWKTLHAWRLRILERPAWKRALEKGNGYDLSSW